MRAGILATALLVAVAGCTGASVKESAPSSTTLLSGLTNSTAPTAQGASLAVSSGAITFRPVQNFPYDWQLSAGNHVARIGNATGNLTLGFLDPNREYTLQVAMRNVTVNYPFRTAPSPWHWRSGALRVGYPVESAFGSVCTLSFLARDAGNETLFAITAGHCFSRVGDLAYAGNFTRERGYEWDGSSFGKVVALESQTGGPDWALISVNPAMRNAWDPAVPSMGGPTGLANQSLLRGGDRVCTYGWGVQFAQARCGYIGLQDPNHPWSWGVVLPGSAGDSGAPVLVEADGSLLGIIVATSGTQTFIVDACHILGWAREAGFRLDLHTGGLTGVWPPAPALSRGDPAASPCTYSPA